MRRNTPIDPFLPETLRVYGCPEVVPLRSLQAESPEQIPYLDLLSKQVRETAPLLPDAVAEFQGRPVMYFLDARTGEPDRSERIELQQRLANRGDHAVLAVVRPGDLTLYPLHLDKKELNQHGLGEVVAATDGRAPFLFQSIATGDFPVPGQSGQADPVFHEIQKLLKRAVIDLVTDAGLDGLAVLSMTGRALFFRFLIDRRIVEEDDLETVCPIALKGVGPHDLRSVFSNAERAAQTSAWLDETFNGDLLPLVQAPPTNTSEKERRKKYTDIYTGAGKKSGGKLFNHLEAILRGWENTGGGVQLKLPDIDWDDLNFRHIPIGVLSQVYEDFSHQVDQQDSLDRSVHYTPRLLAKLLVDQALGGLAKPHEARVLDPACGAGVFLVLALRELVRLRWENDKERLGDQARRPSKQVIQGILHRQICGFDISESALRLAALSLYITVIELNEITRPPSEHHAGKALHDLVLFDQRTDHEKTRAGFVSGSLGDAVDRRRFDGVFDVVVGNPPWSLTKGDSSDPLDALGTRIARRVLERRGLAELAASYKNPGGVPDLPFVWRAMEWARPGGIIAFALEARLILTQTPSFAKARNTLLQSLAVTGILNGSDLEQTSVWAGMKMPWIILWARNETPDTDKHAFQFLTPVREPELAERGRFRLDFKSAYSVPIKKFVEHGWLCKTLGIGTAMDVQVMEKILAAARRKSVETFWRDEKLASTRGLDISPLKESKAPDWLLNLEVFDGEPNEKLLGKHSPTYKELYGDREPNRARKIENYRAPLVLLRRAPGESPTDTKSVRFFDKDTAFSKNYFGYSGAGHPEGSLLVALLHLIAHSSLFLHFAYMRSGQVGARRRIIDKQDIDAFPFPIIEELSKAQREEVKRLADSLDNSGPDDLEAVDSLVYGLFDLSPAERQVVSDTITFSGTYGPVRKQASLPTQPEETKVFARTLEQSLQPFFKVVDQKIRVAVVPGLTGEWRQPWSFVTVLLDGQDWKPSPTLIADLMAEANKTSASRIVMPLPQGGLLIGLINKRRFWTQSRARLCALHISREHLDRSFPLPRR